MLSCLWCADVDVSVVLDLGEQALANEFLREPKEHDKFPLRLGLCGHCGLLQVMERVSPERLFRDYIYVTGKSEMVRVHAEALAERYPSRKRLYGQPALIVEVGSNDGTVLVEFEKRGWDVVGVDPAENVARTAPVKTLPRFFNRETAAEIVDKHGRANIVLARHVFAHCQEPHEFLLAVQMLLQPNGMLLIESPDARDFWKNMEWDTVYHEHATVVGTRPLRRLLAGYGMRIVMQERVALHGGSTIWSIVNAPLTGEARDLLDLPPEAWERKANWAVMRDAVERDCEGLREFLRTNPGTCGYGAPAKGNVRLQRAGVTREEMPCIYDWSPSKVGMLAPGTGIPIVDASEFKGERAVLLAWNFRKEIEGKHPGVEFFGPGKEG